ncbi:unnamed protein product [Litomosoides sigmodontis]|uniref:Uncharacterized protein n=1 Tax=Litomosoides sigmodontis TaxID=42156 RepID=A0A3P7M658_LITSI|nr:unnamed protein product [Litomosoides sigmodontis]
MHLVASILAVSVATTNAISFLSSEWTENVRQFFQQTHQTIGEKSNEFLNEIGKKFDNAQGFVEESKNVFSRVAENLRNSSERLSVTVMKTAETTLRGAGDEVESFFAEVPSRFSDGFNEALEKFGEACKWIFRNIIAPILFIVILVSLVYIFVVSGCFGCCCSSLLSQFGVSLTNTFKQLRTDERFRRGDRIIVLRDLESSLSFQENRLINDTELLKNALRSASELSRTETVTDRANMTHCSFEN